MVLTKRYELFLSYFLLSPHTVNMTLSTSLIANGRQLGCSESVISHCPLCQVKLSREFCMAVLSPSWGFELQSCFREQIQPDGRHTSVAVFAS